MSSAGFCPWSSNSNVAVGAAIPTSTECVSSGILGGRCVRARALFKHGLLRRLLGAGAA